jgi:hypothetical protein
MLDSSVDIKLQIDSAGIEDKLLVRDTPFCEKLLVTEKVKAECKSESQKIIDPLRR